MRILSCFFILIFVAGMISCTGDDETITINTKQCYDGTTVNITEGGKCPPPPTTGNGDTGNGDTGNGDTGGGDAGGGDDGSTGGECNLNATGKAPFDGSSVDDVICGDGDNNTIKAHGGEDIVRAKGGNDIVDGGPGNDELYGEAGNDILTGGEDEDVIDGGPGNDTLTGSEGRDKLIGGEGSDTVKYIGTEMEQVNDQGVPTGDGVPLEINLADGYSDDEYEDQDEYVGIENVEIVGVANTAYTITGDGQANRITGRAGTFTIRAGAGNDVVNISTATAATGTDMIDGGGGIDTLIVVEGTTIDASPYTGFENLKAAEGSAGIALSGDIYPNKLIESSGATTFAGKGGADTFVIKKGDGTDTITDFSIEQGDKVYLCGFSGTSKKTAKEDTENTVQIDGGQEIMFIAGDGFESFTVLQEPEKPASDAGEDTKTTYNEAVAARKIQTNNAAAVINKISNRSGSSCE